MKQDIILAGVGGQGILSIAAVIGLAAMNESLKVKQAEVHGMSQRGGAVQSHLRLSSEEIYSDLIPQGQADLIISVEPMESLRYLPYLSREGWLVTNSVPYENIPSYPDRTELETEIRKVRNNINLDADSIALKTGSKRASNMVILGAASPCIDLDENSFLNAICSLFARKGEEIVGMNQEAFGLGRQFSQNYFM